MHRYAAFALLALLPLVVSAADNVIPHAQDKPPGPAALAGRRRSRR